MSPDSPEDAVVLLVNEEQARVSRDRRKGSYHQDARGAKEMPARALALALVDSIPGWSHPSQQA